MLFACFAHGYKQPYIPLFGTAKLGSKKLTHQLLACKKVNPNQSDECGNSPLHYAVHIESKEVTNELLAFNANPNAKNNKGKTPLHIAVQQDNDYLVRRLMVYGANPNHPDNNGNTPLHLAAKLNNRLKSHRIICDLLSNAANPLLKNNKKKTPLMLAQNTCIENKTMYKAYKQHKNAQRIVCLLQQKNKQTKQPTTLDKQFIKTAKSTHVEYMKHLLKCSAIDINQQVGTYKRTALMYAARNNRTEMVSYLINNTNIDKTLKDTHGNTAYNYAKKSNLKIRNMLQL